MEDERIYQVFLTQTDPVHFELEPLEINLRHYELKGGIFELFMVTKPKTTIFSNRIMTWHYKNSKLQYEIINCDESENNLDRFYLVSFILPEHYTRWKLPVICQWENASKINYDTFQEKDDKLRNSYRMLREICVLKDFRVNKLLSRDEKYNLARHAVPRTISSYKFEMEKQMDNPEDEVKTIKRAADKTVKIDDKIDHELIAFQWKNPERLFPVYPPCQPIQILPEEYESALLSDDEENGPKALFSEVVDELEVYRSKLLPIISNVNDEVVKTKKKRRKSVAVDVPRESVVVPSRATIKIEEIEHTTERKSRATLKRSSTLASVKNFEKEFIEEEEEEYVEEEAEIDIEPKWTTKHIFATDFDPITRKISVKTDRLGVFAWAFDRYVQFPFKKWRLEKDKYVWFLITFNFKTLYFRREKDHETLMFFLETQFIFVYIWINRLGYRGTVSMWLEDQGKYKTLFKFDNISSFPQLKEVI